MKHAEHILAHFATQIETKYRPCLEATNRQIKDMPMDDVGSFREWQLTMARNLISQLIHDYDAAVAFGHLAKEIEGDR